MSRIVRIGAAQLGPISRQDSRPAIVDRLVVLLQQAGRERCDLVVFPELALTSFFPHWAIEDDKELDSYFELDMPNESIVRIFEEARKLAIGFVIGYAELDRGNGSKPQRFNSSILVDRNGSILGKYRKIHLPGYAEVRSNDPF